MPVLLGQVNFFMEFDGCFFHSQAAFEVNPKGKANRDCSAVRLLSLKESAFSGFLGKA